VGIFLICDITQWSDLARSAKQRGYNVNRGFGFSGLRREVEDNWQITVIWNLGVSGNSYFGSNKIFFNSLGSSMVFDGLHNNYLEES
jgi:hypothetical protein